MKRAGNNNRVFSCLCLKCDSVSQSARVLPEGAAGAERFRAECVCVCPAAGSERHRTQQPDSAER